MKVLMVGDVVGKGGIAALATLLPELKARHKLDLVCVQGENAADGFGLTEKVALRILDCGADVITSGNHIWDKREFADALSRDQFSNVLRPHNYPPKTAGSGVVELQHAIFINLLGRVFMNTELDSPFYVVERLLDELSGKNKPIFVDFHAEATSEKYSLAWFLDGRVSAVVGTHTHTPTADTRILPKGTAYVSDLGMVGALNSTLGMESAPAIERFLSGINHRLKPVTSGKMQFNSVMITIDDQTKRATDIVRVDSECVV